MGPPRSSPSAPHTVRTCTESSAAAERCVLPGSARRCSVDPGRVYEDAVAAVWAIGADGDQLEAVVSGLERPHRCGVDANDIPATELADLVVESDLSGAADDDVGLLLFAVAMRRRRADAGAIAQIGDAKVLGVEVLAREPPLDPGRALAHGVLDLVFQIHDGIRAHQFSSLVGQCWVPAGRRYAGAHPAFKVTSLGRRRAFEVVALTSASPRCHRDG